MNEKPQVLIALTRMFDCYGQSPTPSRLETYCDVIGDHLPTDYVLAGIRDAMRECDHFPPGPGPIRRHALAHAKLRAGDSGRVVEMPQERLPRGPWRPLSALLTSAIPTPEDAA